MRWKWSVATSGAIALAVAGALAASPARAQSTVDVRTQTVARVLASGGVEGRFGRPVCQHGLDIEASPSTLFTYALTRESRSPDAPMVLDTGGLLAPHGVARFAAEHDPAALATMVQDIGYRALAIRSVTLRTPNNESWSTPRIVGSTSSPVATNVVAKRRVPVRGSMIRTSNPTRSSLSERPLAYWVTAPRITASHPVISAIS